MIKIQIPSTTSKNFSQVVKQRLESKVPVELPVYTVQHLQALTAVNHAGTLVRCSNGNAGAECLAFCDGFNWRVIELGSNISLA